MQSALAGGGCPAPGSCTEVHATPGCENAACCETVCSLVPECCVFEWDALCVSVASDPGLGDLCGGGPGCPIDCPPGGSDEEEVCGDTTNDGCNLDPAAFGSISVGETICGTTFADAGTRDTDWFSMNVTDPDGNGVAEVIITWQSQFPSQVLLIDPGDCDAPFIFGGDVAANCIENTFSVTVPAPGTYTVFIAPGTADEGIFEGIFCGGGSNEYAISVDVGPGVQICNGPGSGDCFTETPGVPGCADTACCEAVCAVDPFCCATEWDSICVGEAVTLCEVSTESCGGDNPNDCSVANETPGCSDQACCEAVCAVDAFCCAVAWDAVCAVEADQFCGKGPCVLECPEGGAFEDEECGGDENNGGCNVDPAEFDAITSGDIICGTSFAQGGTRDVDWYSFPVTDPDGNGFATVTVTVNSNFPSLYAIGNSTDCATVEFVGVGDSIDCVTETLQVNVPAPGNAIFLIGPGTIDDGPFFEAFPCGGANDYWFELEVQGNQCTVSCPGGSTPEPEACGADVNGGCNAEPPAFTNITSGQTYCGDVFAETVNGQGARDTDWYRLNLTDPDGDGQALVTFTVNSEVPLDVLLLDGLCPPEQLFADAAAGECTPVQLSVCLPAPGAYNLFLAPATNAGPVFDGFPCSTGVTDYTLSCTVVNASPECQPNACPSGGSIVLNQTGDTVTNGLGVACPAGTNRFARSWNFATIPATAGEDVTLYCVQFGVEANTGNDRVCTLNVYRDINGGNPTTPVGGAADLQLLGSQPVTIAGSDDLTVLTVSFNTPIVIPANTVTVVELVVPPQSPGSIFPGCSTDPETAPTFIMAPNCGLNTFATMASIGQPQARWIQNLVIDVGATTDPCPADLDGNGEVDGADLGLLLGAWDTSGPGDIDGSGLVDGADLGLLLGAWGTCPG